MARKQHDQAEPEKSPDADPGTAVTEEVAVQEDPAPEGAGPASADTASSDAEHAAGAEAEDMDAEHHDVEHHEPEHHEHDLEEHGNFPTWLKVMLILLFGAGIALWGGPRLAPLLPSGLEPVARFLAPGGVRQAEEIDARLSALEQRQPPAVVSDEAVDAAVRSALEEYDASIREELTALRDTISAVGSADIKTRLATLETAVEGLEAQMASLGDQLSATVAESLERQSAMSAEQAASYQAMIDRLNAELDQLAARQGGLQQEIDEVAATNIRIKQEAASIVSVSQAEKAVTDIAAALETGAAFRPALDLLAGAVEGDLAGLQAVADSGTPSLSALKTSFPGLAHEALRASMRADADSYTDRALAFIKSQVVTRSLTPQAGDSTDAVLSRVEAALTAGNLTECLTEAEALSPAARAPLAGWLESVRKLSDALAELATATAQISRQKS